MQDANRIELTYGLSVSEVCNRLRQASDKVDYNKRVLAFYLAEMVDRKLYTVGPHADTHHFAATQLHMDRRRTDEYIQIGKALQELYLLDEAFLAGRISWTQVLTLMRVMQRDTQKVWIDFAEQKTCRELDEEVKGCLPGEIPGDGSNYGLVHAKVVIKAKLCDVAYAMFEEARVRLSPDKEKLLDDTELIEELLRRVLNGTPEPKRETAEVHEKTETEIPQEVRESVLRRDGHLCRNCRSRYDVWVHHIEFRSHGGDHDPGNLLALCMRCHASVHRGFLVIKGNPQTHDGITFTSNTGEPVERGDRSPTPKHTSARGDQPPGPEQPVSHGDQSPECAQR